MNPKAVLAIKSIANITKAIITDAIITTLALSSKLGQVGQVTFSRSSL